jgi:hypothetical protein
MITVEDFLKTSFNCVTSSKRSRKFHKVLLNDILNAKLDWAEYDWEYEYKLLDGFGGTFAVDIAGLVNGEIKVAILAKAINSSVNKNIKNFANTSIGESARLMFAPNINLEKILFISVLPKVAPRFDKHGNVKGFDIVKNAKNRTKIDHILQSQYNGVVETMDLYYDVANIKTKMTKDDFASIIVENLDELILK